MIIGVRNGLFKIVFERQVVSFARIQSKAFRFRLNNNRLFPEKDERIGLRIPILPAVDVNIR